MVQRLALGAVILVMATWLLPAAKTLMLAYPAHWRELSRSQTAIEHLGEPSVDVLRFAWARWSAREFLTPDAIQRAGREAPVEVARGTADVEIEARSPRHIRLQIDSPDEQVLVKVNQFYYPGWEAHNAIDNTRYDVAPSAGDGRITILAPGGHHDVDLTLPTTPAERIGALSSIAGLLICGWWLLAVMGGRPFRPISAESPVLHCEQSRTPAAVSKSVPRESC